MHDNVKLKVSNNFLSSSFFFFFLPSSSSSSFSFFSFFFFFFLLTLSSLYLIFPKSLEITTMNLDRSKAHNHYLRHHFPSLYSNRIMVPTTTDVHTDRSLMTMVFVNKKINLFKC
uniref:Uncharacterized protein n=1 Tax=Cacopsylla melanoneura TaxID=428564 RepID=A0A8D8WS95_9HEMI